VFSYEQHDQVLVPVFEQRVPQGLHHQFVNVGPEQIVEAGGASAFFEGHREGTAQSCKN